jgi:membrane fusion protein (multidrug efflux system)
VQVSVDAYPDLDLRGTVDSVQAGTGSRFSIIPAENATGNFVKVVQRVPVKITLQTNASDSEQFLSPGMSVEPSVRVR